MEGERCGMERREMMWDGEGRDDAGWRGERWIKKREMNKEERDERIKKRKGWRGERWG